MNYKKIIPNQDVRLKILKSTEYIPDKIMIKLQYYLKTGRKLRLKKPERFTEKIQYYKLYCREEMMTRLADKAQARNYIKSKNLEEILIPLYGIYNNADEIDFDKLPNRFVIKLNNGSGTNILCKSKQNLNIEETKNIINSWLKNRTVKAGREWAYYNIEPKIIIEKFMESEEGLIDYKFYCFNGEPQFIKISLIENLNNVTNNSFYDLEFKKLPYLTDGVKGIERNLPEPKKFDKMVEICRTLSKDFPHVRVDLYNLEGEIYFGEFTFYDNSGYQLFVPDEFDYILGEQFILNN
ncbi:ATP-grasp fold amidoligase family protein [Salinicoccus roseus]|uniref:ATP-grasp fold amidoligase family protein n=1 Tax=Salinicoccus roseus TaxID=45670 RepID=UPI000F4EDE45|nr:ATP-grasp fold amidoligase family protein [Salinicoccus roseus]RPE54772.1 teichuronopeptide biosynthesis TupA-like protein [Salinicoccus roseus]GGA62729.1 hypothetical protein GCM10007176_03980 [Salinicoccus roseus]